MVVLIRRPRPRNQPDTTKVMTLSALSSPFGLPHPSNLARLQELQKVSCDLLRALPVRAMSSLGIDPELGTSDGCNETILIFPGE